MPVYHRRQIKKKKSGYWELDNQREDNENTGTGGTAPGATEAAEEGVGGATHGRDKAAFGG